MSPTQKLVRILTAIALVLAVTCAACGIFIRSIYADNDFVKTAWLGNDWVTLVVVAPALVLVLIVAWNKKSLKTDLLLSGLVAYLLYNYAFYLFGAMFNKFFLIYVAICCLGMFILILLLPAIRIQPPVLPSKLLKWISAYLLFIAVMLCIVELPPILNFVIFNELPDIIQKTNHPTGIVYALDFLVIIPVMTIASFLLWHNQSWAIFCHQ